jgi:Ca2+-binding RTX toxin-like protein
LDIRRTLEPIERRLCFSTLIGGDWPEPIPAPTFADGILHVHGTDVDDRVHVQTYESVLSYGDRSLVLDGAGAWRPLRAGEIIDELQYIVSADKGPINTYYYHAPVSRTRGMVVETAGGDDEFNFARYDPVDLLLTLIGGSGNDVLNASLSAGATVIGGAGRDHVWASSSGPIFVEGGRDADTIYGSSRNDTIYAGDGDDVVYGSAGFDTIYGAEGNDTLLGEADGDVLFGGMDQDLLDGGAGGDHLLGEDSNDFLEGGPDNNILDGGARTDTLHGGDGNDYLIGGRGYADSLRGGAGNDKFRVDDAFGNRDSLWGEAGFDVLVSVADADDLFIRGPQTR